MQLTKCIKTILFDYDNQRKNNMKHNRCAQSAFKIIEYLLVGEYKWKGVLNKTDKQHTCHCVPKVQETRQPKN